MQSNRAESVLRRAGFRPTFGWLPDAFDGSDRMECLGPPGAGPVRAQDPDMNVRLPYGAGVILTTGCPSNASMQPCRDHDFELSVGSGGGLGHAWEYVKLNHVAGLPCRLDRDVTLSIEQGGRPLAVVANNPATMHLDKPIGVGEEVLLTWYEGGCPDSPTGHVTYVVRLGTAVGEEADTTLNCGPEDRSPPSLAQADIAVGTSVHEYQDVLEDVTR